jgi:predicted ATPase
VLWGGSGAHATQLPYAPFAVALDGHATGRLDHERIARILSDLARTRSVVLVLGDLHDLDRASLDLLEYLAHLARGRRWLILATVREEDVEVGSELWRITELTVRERLCTQVRLEPLERPECDQLVRVILPGSQVAEAALDYIYARSLGNPLFVEELVREMLERSELLPASGCWRTSAHQSDCAPERVQALVAMRVAATDASLRSVLGLAAAAGGVEISLSELRAGVAELGSPLTDAALFDALDRALEMRLLEERDGGYAFHHPLVRAALYEHLPRHRRDQLHAALVRAAAVEVRCVPA